MEWFTIGFWGTAGVLGFIVATILVVITLLVVGTFIHALWQRLQLHNDRIAYRWDRTAEWVEEGWAALDRRNARLLADARSSRYRKLNTHLFDGTCGRNGVPYKAGEGPWGARRPWMKPGVRYELERDMANDLVLWAADGVLMNPQPEDLRASDLRQWLS